jgi:hypothetical protein
MPRTLVPITINMYSGAGWTGSGEGEKMTYCCLQCVGEMIQAERQHLDPVPQPEEAITLAPSWQQQVVGGQMIMACVTVPTCLKHLVIGEVSPIQRALSNGLVIPGQPVK